MIDLWAKDTSSDAGLVLLTVCEGNICRSPLAAQLLRAQLPSIMWERVESAGLGAVVGAPMDEIAAALSAQLGGAPDGHVARQLTTELVSEADVILTMTQQQRDVAVSRHPRGLRKTFTLAEFGKLLNIVETDETTASPRAVRDLIRHLSASRPSVKLTAHDDVEDPYRKSRDVHAIVAAQIDTVCGSIARVLTRG